MANNPNSSEKILGRIIRQARREAGLTSRDLARESGLNLHTIFRLEQGKTTRARRVCTLYMLCCVLRVSPPCLFCSKGAADWEERYNFTDRPSPTCQACRAKRGL